MSHEDGAFCFGGEHEGARALPGTRACRKVPATVALEALLAGVQ